MQKQQIILTGDRPSGKLHLGHFVGSLKQRLLFQEKSEYQQYIMIADVQALTDNYDNPQKVHDNIINVMLDYLSIGLDYKKNNIFLQSMISEIAELTVYYMNLVSIARLKRNPTVKLEMQQKGYKDNVSIGFLAYPISQAADITIVRANLVPVGADQLPMIEQTNEIIRKFNAVYFSNVDNGRLDSYAIEEVKAIVNSATHLCRLPGIDGFNKMSKSLNNAIYLSDSSDELYAKVMKMYTDPNHIKISDPGSIINNAAFTYLDAFDSDVDRVNQLKLDYQKGGLGDVTVKKYLFSVLNNLLEPIRSKRADIEKNNNYRRELIDIIHYGVEKTRLVTKNNLNLIKDAMHLNLY